jgi:predicted transcriptional regulator
MDKELSVSYEASLIESLKDPKEAAAYLEAAIEDGDLSVLKLALRHVAQAHSGSFTLSPEDEDELLAAMAEIERGEFVSAEDLLKSLRKYG